MTKLMKVDVLSAAKLSAALIALLGFVAGIIYSFGGLLVDAAVSFGWITS